MKKQLLREWHQIEYTADVIEESKKNNGGKIIIPAVLQKAHTKNKNERIYTKDLLMREMQNYKKVVDECRALGELDHPESSTVALDRVSHIVRNVYWDGDTVRGDIEVLETPKGKILRSLLESGVKVGMSSRGVGSTKKTNEGTDVVQDDYQLICFDAVSEPSTPGAYINESRLVEVEPEKIWTKSDRIWRALTDLEMKK